MPVILEIAFVVLSCTHIGAMHSVMFTGFYDDSLRYRAVNACR